MMFKPSVNELINVANKNILNDTQKVKSKFTIVMATSKRARQLVEDRDERVEGGANALTVAINEFEKEAVKVVREN